MTGAGPAPSSHRVPLAVILVALGFALGLTLARLPSSLLGALSGPGQTRIDQATVLERLNSAATLVTTEVALRDVITFQNTRLGSTKRSLVVVTGKALVGFDLKDHATAQVDESAKVVHITLPHATIRGVDIGQLRTYDETRGLWNPFHPEDRDTIYQLARSRLAHAAQDLEVVAHAEAGAKSVMSALFASSGYRVEVSFVPFLVRPPTD